VQIRRATTTTPANSTKFHQTNPINYLKPFKIAQNHAIKTKIIKFTTTYTQLYPNYTQFLPPAPPTTTETPQSKPKSQADKPKNTAIKPIKRRKTLHFLPFFSISYAHNPIYSIF
jgi:hypothetical protein